MVLQEQNRYATVLRQLGTEQTVKKRGKLRCAALRHLLTFTAIPQTKDERLSLLEEVTTVLAMGSRIE